MVINATNLTVAATPTDFPIIAVAHSNNRQCDNTPLCPWPSKFMFQSSYAFPPNQYGTNGVSSQSKPEEKPTPDKTDDSPELPVLRHLRPEFRDQLTVAPRRSLGPR